MRRQLRLMGVLAHPDDETLGMGGTLARYAAEGVVTSLFTATRGQQGWFGEPSQYPGPEALGQIRERELTAAADVLGLQHVTLLDYMDGELDRVPSAAVIDRIVTAIRRFRPHVVLTFDPNGGYGHPDHIAISQFTTAALIAATDPAYPAAREWPPHRVSKLYYRVFTQAEMDAYQAAFGDLVMEIDGMERRVVPWKEWAITTRIDTHAYWRQVWQAVECHRSQLPGYESLLRLPEEHQQAMWAEQTFYRAFSLVNGGREVESDLFEGLREPVKEWA